MEALRRWWQELGRWRYHQPGRVLVTADLIVNQNYVELERAESGEKTAANVAVIDNEANLALLEPTEFVAVTVTRIVDPASTETRV